MAASKTYTDDNIRAMLALMVQAHGYRKTGARLGFDHAILQRIVTGSKPMTENVAVALGFIPCDRKWTRK